ncbi:hypothetical protein C0J52_06010 [Blattella germanica]|nr:hypothetical protein C0J52_06010 [Blattella germanica]
MDSKQDYVKYDLNKTVNEQIKIYTALPSSCVSRIKRSDENYDTLATMIGTCYFITPHWRLAFLACQRGDVMFLIKGDETQPLTAFITLVVDVVLTKGGGNILSVKKRPLIKVFKPPAKKYAQLVRIRRETCLARLGTDWFVKGYLISLYAKRISLLYFYKNGEDLHILDNM